MHVNVGIQQPHITLKSQHLSDRRDVAHIGLTSDTSLSALERVVSRPRDVGRCVPCGVRNVTNASTDYGNSASVAISTFSATSRRMPACLVDSGLEVKGASRQVLCARELDMPRAAMRAMCMNTTHTREESYTGVYQRDRDQWYRDRDRYRHRYHR